MFYCSNTVTIEPPRGEREAYSFKAKCLNTVPFPFEKVSKKTNVLSSSKPSCNMQIHNMKIDIVQKLNKRVPHLMFLLSALGALN